MVEEATISWGVVGSLLVLVLLAVPLAAVLYRSLMSGKGRKKPAREG